jgi:thioesterase domain-containing protein
LATRLISRIRSSLDVEIAIRSLFEAPSVEALAKSIAVGKSAQSDFETLLPIRPHGALSPLFCIHPGGGFSWAYSRLIRHIPAGHPIYGLQARSLANPEISVASVEDMAADYVDLIREIQPLGPYNLVGVSFGGLVAHAMATQLQRVGQGVALLALLDSYPRDHKNSLKSSDHEKAHLFAGVNDDVKADMDEQMFDGEVADVIKNMLAGLYRDGHILSTLDEHHYDSIMNALKRSFPLVRNFVPQRFHGDVILFAATASESGEIEPPIEAWRPYVDGKIEAHRIDCTHVEIMDPVPIAKIGSVLAAELAQPRMIPVPTLKEKKDGH